MAPVSSEPEVAFFIDTDIGTRFAVAVPPGITSAAFKREVERVHYNCFPKLGEIKVHRFMVERKSNLYYLPATMLIKFATWGAEGVRSLHVKVRRLNEFDKPCLHENTDSRTTCKNKIRRADGKKRTRKRCRAGECLSRQICLSVSPWRIRRRRKKASRNQLVKCMEKNLDTGDHIRDAENPDFSTPKSFIFMPKYEVDAASDLSSEVISVSSIINRYFPNFDEVSSEEKMVYNNTTPQFSTERVQNLLHLPMARSAGQKKPERSKLGKGIVMASYKLGVSPGKERPEILLCNSRGRIVKELLCSSLANFEISDSED